MKGIGAEVDKGHFLIGDFLAFRVDGSVDFGVYPESFRSGGVGDERDDYGEAFERLTAPVLGDVAEHFMFDLVPFTGARRQMTDIDLQPGLSGEALQ